MKWEMTTVHLREGAELLAMLPSGMIGPIKMGVIHGLPPGNSIVILCVGTVSPPLMISTDNGGKVSVEELHTGEVWTPLVNKT